MYLYVGSVYMLKPREMPHNLYGRPMSHVTSCRTRTSSAAQGIWNLIADSQRGFFQRFLNAKKGKPKLFHGFSMQSCFFDDRIEIVQNNLAGIVWK